MLENPQSPVAASRRTARERCTLCSTEKTVPFFTKHRYRFRKCRECDHVFVVVPEELHQIQHEEAVYTPEYLEQNRAWFEVLARKRAEIVESLDLEQDARTLLDVGCGFGFFLNELRTRGWSSVGIESAGPPLTCATDELELDIVEGWAPEAFQEFSRNSIDVITFWHVLEHVEQPGRVLTQALDLLKPGGYLVINSPNLSSAVFRLIGRRWSWIYVPGHLQYFSLYSLARWLEAAGGDICRAETWTDAPNLYFLLEEGLLLTLCDGLARSRIALLEKMESHLRSFVYKPFHQQVIQLKWKKLYDWTPFLDFYLNRNDLGHEFLLIVQRQALSTDFAQKELQGSESRKSESGLRLNGSGCI